MSIGSANCGKISVTEINVTEEKGYALNYLE